ncbi:spondin domain-containing protein [Halorussus caseinilyticus]|uniref:Spondin domain-containing protein n=1 Tax=Halorussus caseinilyticus TaxID=3034025 RepID=A0ABD5WRT8_9EURY
MTNDSIPTTRRTVLTGVASALTAVGVAGAQETTTEAGTTTARGETTAFQVRIVNASGPDALQPEGGEPGPVVLSPGVYAAHSPSVQLFASDESAPEGLEALAEDGDPSQLASAIEGADGIVASGTFDTPVAGGEPGPIGPGDAYGFQVEAAPGDRLSFATMFVPSNDLFFAPGPNGIEFFRDGDPSRGT